MADFSLSSGQGFGASECLNPFCLNPYLSPTPLNPNVAVILLKGVTIKIFPGPDFPGARGVLIA